MERLIERLKKDAKKKGCTVEYYPNICRFVIVKGEQRFALDTDCPVFESTFYRRLRTL